MQNPNPAYISQSIGALVSDIHHLKDYFGYLECSDTQEELRRGLMTKIMLSELDRQAGVLAEHNNASAAFVIGNKWEQARVSSALYKKVGLLKTISSILIQLPPTNEEADAFILHLSQHVIERCNTIASALEGVVANAAISMEKRAIGEPA